MPVRICLLFIVSAVLFSPATLKSQQHPGSIQLGPFHYGMHIDEVLSSGYNLIHQEQLRDGTHLLALMLNPGEGTIAVLQFPPFRMPYAYSIQISGTDPNQPLFDDIRLGMSRHQLYQRLGTPSDSTFIQNRDVMLYFYDYGNYSFEVSEETGLYSFAIRGDESILRYIGFADNWLNYQPMRITQAVSMYEPDDENLPMILFNSIPFRPRVVFTGRSRAAVDGSMQILDIWGKSRSIEPDVIASYKIEIEVTDGNAPFWLMMDEGMLEALISETENGVIPVDLFAVIIGFNEAGPVMVCNEFVAF